MISLANLAGAKLTTTIQYTNINFVCIMDTNMKAKTTKIIDYRYKI